MIIGFCGAAGSGKDTAGAALSARGFERVSFAAALKGVLSVLFCWEPELWDNLEWKETPNQNCYGRTPREMAQSFGTDWGRNMVDPNIWVDTTMRMLEGPGNFVFTDVRFPNEARAIRNAGGVLIFVECTDRPQGTARSSHESEAWLPWLELYADAGITAPLGEVGIIHAASLNIADNYAYGTVPRHVPDADAQESLEEIEERIHQSLKEGTTND